MKGMKAVTWAGFAATLLVLPVSFAAADQAQGFTGAVRIEAVHGWGIAVGVDEASPQQSPDGRFEHLFLLQAYGPKPPELPLDLSLAQVSYKDAELCVTSEAEGLQIRLRLLTPHLPSPPIPGFKQLAWQGFGLSHRDLRQQPVAARSLDVFWPEAGDPAVALRRTCNSGGPGASQCSVTATSSGCSITCVSGYYACCSFGGVLTGPSCECVFAGGGSGGGGGGGGGGSDCAYSDFCPAWCMACTPRY